MLALKEWLLSEFRLDASARSRAETSNADARPDEPGLWSAAALHDVVVENSGSRALSTTPSGRLALGSRGILNAAIRRASAGERERGVAVNGSG
jgi:hypothetical protein